MDSFGVFRPYIRNVAEITSTTMHPGFRASLPDLKFKKP